MKLTKNFNREEFDCRDGTQVPTVYYKNLQELADNLQILRDHLGEPVQILSGYRTPTYNKKLKGSARFSQHLKAKAGDLTVKSLSPKQLKATIEKLIAAGKMKNGGIGLYPGFVHYDTGDVRRW